MRTGIASPSHVAQTQQDGMAPSHWSELMALLCPTELAGRRAGCARGGSPVPREEERSWAQLPGSRPRPGRCSSSSSVRTEDFAASFWEAMVEPLLCQQEPAGAVPTAGAHPGQDEPLFPTGRSLGTATEPGRAPRQDRSPSRSSLESLGARISCLSQSHGGVAWGVPWPGPPAQPALGHRDWPGRSWRAAGIAAGRSRAGARTGSPGSSAPRASRATTRGHPSLGPPALWGRAGNVTFTVAATDREGAASSRSAGTAVGAPGRWGSPESPGLRGDQKGELPCKCWMPGGGGAATALVPVEEPGGDTRAGIWCQALQPRGQSQDWPGTAGTHPGHPSLVPHGPAEDGESWQGQGAHVGQKQLDKERRKTATSQEEKLELLERLRELERGSCSLLRQRLRVLHRLHGLLQRDRNETLRQLREALGQERPGCSVRREHLPSRPRDAAGPGRAGGSPALESPPVAPRGHGPRPGSAVGSGPSPAALGCVPGAAQGDRGVPLVRPCPCSSSLPSPSRALHVLRGLRQQIQRRLGQWQKLEGALGAAGQRKEEGEQRQQPQKAPAPGAPREPLIQRRRERAHPASSPSLSSLPGLAQPGRGSPGLLQPLRHRFQELRLEKTPSTGSPPVLGGQLGTRGSEGQPGPGAPAVPQPRR
ncbi:collagen alpha-1(I) chain-like [Motacilla alba alba]|uniref:collagen alpha-1(I) chain-like n=1 Tax=Motacilla alba alba TaxID=1094192 RepID=UPI0018D5581F|nr:collagen alpha-1(I) chain-like [Motacilla alba alba]